MGKGQILKGLQQQSTVPESVCPKVEPAWVDFAKSEFISKDDFISQKDFASHDYEKQYYWVFERLRSFYTQQCIPSR